MAGGRRIDDHSNWMGAPSKESPLPMQAKMKQESSAEGAGHEADYEDTTEKIKQQQMDNVAKIKGRPLKPLYRN